jgi:hypothetical protein
VRPEQITPRRQRELGTSFSVSFKDWVLRVSGGMPTLKHITKYAAPAETEKEFRKSVVPLLNRNWVRMHKPRSRRYPQAG